MANTLENSVFGDLRREGTFIRDGFTMVYFCIGIVVPNCGIACGNYLQASENFISNKDKKWEFEMKNHFEYFINFIIKITLRSNFIMFKEFFILID